MACFHTEIENMIAGLPELLYCGKERDGLEGKVPERSMPRRLHAAELRHYHPRSLKFSRGQDLSPASRPIEMESIGYPRGDEPRLFDLNIEEVLDHWEVEHAIRELIANALTSSFLPAALTSRSLKMSVACGMSATSTVGCR